MLNAVEKKRLFRSKLDASNWLSKMGFSENGVEHVNATNLIPEGYRINFCNKKKRTISFKLFSLDDKEIVAVNIINNENGESFGLEDWLKYKNMFKSYDALRLTSYDGEFHERVDSFLIYLSGIFSTTPLVNVLEGDIWENVPFDWAGMR